MKSQYSEEELQQALAEIHEGESVRSISIK